MKEWIESLVEGRTEDDIDLRGYVVDVVVDVEGEVDLRVVAGGMEAGAEEDDGADFVQRSQAFR